MKKRSEIKLAVTLAALADPVRLRLLLVLERDELSVGELTAIVQLPQSTTSRHLKVLGDAGLLNRRAVGPAMLLRLVLDDLTPETRALWVAVRDQAGEMGEEDRRRLAGVLAERKLDARTFFGRSAGEWDGMRTRLFGAEFALRAMLTLLPREWVVADLGCGTGNASELLAPNVERVLAVDNSETMLESARKRLRGVKNVQFAAGGLERLPLKSGSVDATVCVLVLPYVEDPGAAIGEMRRVLRTERRGGVALIVDMLAHGREEFRTTMGHRHLGFGQDRVAEWMKGAGFGEVRVQTLPPDPEARGPGLFAATGRIR